MKIFVYGSLKKGFGNNSLLKTSIFIGNHTIQGYEMYNFGWYPAIIEGKLTDEVQGEIWEVDSTTKMYIDGMELGAGYRIEKTIIDGETVEFYVYKYPIMYRNKVESGVWEKDYLERTKIL